MMSPFKKFFHTFTRIGILCIVFLTETHVRHSCIDARGYNTVPRTFPSQSENSSLLIFNGEFKPFNSNDSHARNCTRTFLREMILRSIIGKNLGKSDSRKEMGGGYNKLATSQKNVFENLMKLFESMEELENLFIIRGDMNPADSLSKNNNATKTETVDRTNLVLVLLIIILCLGSYIGYLWYEIKTRYKLNQNSNILIEDGFDYS